MLRELRRRAAKKKRPVVQQPASTADRRSDDSPDPLADKFDRIVSANEKTVEILAAAEKRRAEKEKRSRQESEDAARRDRLRREELERQLAAKERELADVRSRQNQTSVGSPAPAPKREPSPFFDFVVKAAAGAAVTYGTFRILDYFLNKPEPEPEPRYVIERVPMEHPPVEVETSVTMDGETLTAFVEGVTEYMGINADKFRGTTGAQGQRGPCGMPGVDGRNGRAGRSGRRGQSGRNGINGRHGRNGSNGRNGRDGRDGIDGANSIMTRKARPKLGDWT